MTPLGRVAAALGALLFITVLAHALATGDVDERRLYLVLLAAAAAAWFTRPGALDTLAWVVPFGPVIDFAFLTPGRGIYATEVILLAALASWLTGRLFGRERGRWPMPNLPTLLFCNFGAIALVALIAGHAERFLLFTAYRMGRVLLLAATTGFLFSALALDETRRDRAIRAWTASTLGALGLLGLFGLAQFLFGRHSGHFEPGSFYASSVGLAVHVAFFGPVALCVALGASDRRWRLGALVAWLAAVICLPLTASRGALGATLITLALAVLAALRRTRGRGWRLAAIAVLVAGIGAVVLMSNPELAGEAFAYKYRASIAGDFFSTRVDEWREAAASIRAQPFFGEGPDAWAPSIPLELMRRHGVPAALLGLAAIVAGIVSLGRRAWRWDAAAAPTRIGGLHVASTAWGLTLGLLGLLLVGLAETGLGARTTPLLSMALAMTGVVHVRSQGATKDTSQETSDAAGS